MRSIMVKNPAMLTTVQGGARIGFRRFGMPVAGAMDNFSMRCANWLAGNNQYSPLLESTLIGPEIEFLTSMHFSITGGECYAKMDNRVVENWKTIEARKGSILSVGPVESGARIYLAFSGGLIVDEIMGSASTYLPGKTGGLQGCKILKGDIIPVGKPSKGNYQLRVINPEYIPFFNDIVTLRVLSGVDFNFFAETEILKLQDTTYTVSLNSDRMGIRLEGDSIESVNSDSDVISYGIHNGAIQIPGDGKPIIMGVDAQTTGGYRQVANVISADLDILAQLKPFHEVRFKLIDYDEAILLLKEKEKFIEYILS